MKKKFKDTKFAKILGSILKGAIKDTSMPIVGTVLGAAAGAKEAISQIANEGKNDETGGKGNANYVRLISSIITLLLVVSLIAGWIDEKTFERVLGLVNN